MTYQIKDENNTNEMNFLQSLTNANSYLSLRNDHHTGVEVTIGENSTYSMKFLISDPHYMQEIALFLLKKASEINNRRDHKSLRLAKSLGDKS